jgi:hypothetical protein
MARSVPAAVEAALTVAAVADWQVDYLDSVVLSTFRPPVLTSDPITGRGRRRASAVLSVWAWE